MRNGRGVGIFVKSRWLYVLAALILVASGRASAADRGRSAGHRQATTAASTEVAPIVVIDPRNGAVVKIWSRGDGFSAKLAWARLRGSGWGPAHDLTFGLGNDLDPAVGMTSGGAWLFWHDERGEVFYAPLEIASGRLLGVPAPLSSGGRVGPNRAGGGPGLEGGIDSPTVLRNCPQDDPVCLASRNPGGGTTNPGPYVPPVMGENSLVSIGLNGGVDSPTTMGSSGSGGVVVTSEPTCDRQIVTLPQGDNLLVLEVDGAGRVQGRTVASLEPGVTAEQAGSYFLLESCRP